MSNHSDRSPRPERWNIRIIQTCHGCGKEGETSEIAKEWLNPYHVFMGDHWLQTCLCPSCARWHPRFWFKGRRIGYFWSQFFHPSPGIGYCGKCHTTWDYVSGHSTAYRDSSGCFPLCEGCWRELTPQRRLPYYRTLFSVWERNAAEYGYPMDVAWETIERAVLNERPTS